MATHANSTPTLAGHVTAPTSPVSRRRSLIAAASAVVMGSGITAGTAACVADTAFGLEFSTADDLRLVEMGAEGRVLCDEHSRLMARWWTLKPQDPEVMQIGEAAVIPHDRLCVLADEANSLQATTTKACQAKARLLCHHLLVECESEGEMIFHSRENELAWSLVCDLLAGA